MDCSSHPPTKDNSFLFLGEGVQTVKCFVSLVVFFLTFNSKNKTAITTSTNQLSCYIINIHTNNQKYACQASVVKPEDSFQSTRFQLHQLVIKETKQMCIKKNLKVLAKNSIFSLQQLFATANIVHMQKMGKLSKFYQFCSAAPFTWQRP